MPEVTFSRPTVGTGALLATGCGTAIASVCALGLFRIERLLGGLWSVAAILCAGACCAVLAGAFARLSRVVPSGAGVLAYLARGLGRPAGLALALPYLLLTLFLVGAEATLVGRLVACLAPVPPVAGSLAFLLGTWALCRAGVRVSYRAQAVATWALVGGLAALSLASLGGAARSGDFAARLLPAAPGAAHFVAGVGQALFLFMGFELITSQVEVASSPRAVGRALRGSVVVLAAFYALVSLGFSCLGRTPEGAGELLVPQVAVAANAGGPLAVGLIVVLSVLASFTSYNGALLALSRFVAALAAQGVLPRRLGRVEPHTLVARAALAALLALAVAATALVGFGGAMHPSILAGAAAAAVVYAAVTWVRERPPFAKPGRSAPRRLAGRALAAALVALAVGVLADAGPALGGTLALLGVAGAAALIAARRARRRVTGGVTHAR
jgi:amino acid transporter